MDDLDHRAQAHRAPAAVIHELGGHQQQRRTQPLAAAFAQVLADFGDGGDAGDGIAAEFLLHGGQVLAQELENSFSVRADRSVQRIPDKSD